METSAHHKDKSDPVNTSMVEWNNSTRHNNQELKEHFSRISQAVQDNSALRQPSQQSNSMLGNLFDGTVLNVSKLWQRAK
tara:strand:+ start:244 stop:483 length:240 start_codon:yes stop_codon:yes gene_type:complete